MADEKKSREDDVRLYSDEELGKLVAKSRRLGCANETCFCDGSCRGEGKSSAGWRKKSKPSELNVKISADVGEAITGFKALQRELRNTTKEARELESAYKDAERAINSDKIAQINKLRDLQGKSGNYDVSDYMAGLYNGLELASATLEGREPEYKDKPTNASDKTVQKDIDSEHFRKHMERRFSEISSDILVQLDGKEISEAIAPDKIDISTKDDDFTCYDLSDVPTKELHEELAKREGVKEYCVGNHGEHAIIKFYDEDGNVSNVDVEGARILVNKD